jgi:hypothetical protein
MKFLEWVIGSDRRPDVRPRSLQEIRADVEARERPHLERLSRVEDSLLALTAEAGLDDLRRQMEHIRGDGP